MKKGADLILKTVDAILNDTVETIPQNEYITNQVELKPAPKIFRETCKINWNQPAENIYNFIRGLSPSPAAWTELEIDAGNTLNLKIFESSVKNKTHDLLPGTIVTDNKTYLSVAAKDGFLEISDIQASGKKRMKIRDFLNGFHIANHAIFK
jgi:methionyl-tRNA formyltransferase